MAAGYKDFTASSVLAAADLEDYCENQSVMRFTDATARDTALSAVKTEGMMAYLISTNVMTVYSGSAWSTVGTLHGAPLAWTPAITQSGNVAYTDGGSFYTRIGRLILFETTMAVTGSGTVSNVVTVSLPVAAAASYGTYSIFGQGEVRDASGPTLYALQMRFATSTTVKFSTLTAGATDPTYWGVSPTTALASGDQVSLHGHYYAAADA